MDIFQKVEKQYSSWIYPHPLQDLAFEKQHGYWQLHSPKHFWELYFPNRPYNEPIDILVAGCGTNEAAYCAYENPHFRIDGIDLSENSLSHHNFLKEKHCLNNLCLYKLNLLNVNNLNKQYDLIICVGVLHHMPEPQDGLSALRKVLKPDGKISLMLYGKYPRVGVYMLQDIFRRLEVSQSKEDVNFVRTVVDSLPKWHHLQIYRQDAPELGFDTGLVDTFLHPQDRAYTVQECIELVENSGLKFIKWIDSIGYSLGAAVPKANPLWIRASRLSKIEQAAIVEVVAQSIGCHRFIAGTEETLKSYPVLIRKNYTDIFPRLRFKTLLETGEKSTLKREFQSLPLTRSQLEFLGKSDGTKSIIEIVESIKKLDFDLTQFIEDMDDFGHLLLGTVRGHQKP